MTPDEILKTLDDRANGGKDLLAQQAYEAAALIRQLQDEIHELRLGSLDDESIHDRDARAAMGMFFGTPEGCAESAFRYADAMAAERARRAKGGK